MVMTDNDNGNGGTTNTLNDTMWQYDYAEQQFANDNRYAFFSVFRNSYPARTALCGTLHLTSVPCQLMIATRLLDRMVGHSINPTPTLIGGVGCYGRPTEVVSGSQSLTLTSALFRPETALWDVSGPLWSNCRRLVQWPETGLWEVRRGLRAYSAPSSRFQPAG